jgi:hypothetical protein
MFSSQPLQYINASAVCLQKGMLLASLETELDFFQITKLMEGKLKTFSLQTLFTSFFIAFFIEHESCDQTIAKRPPFVEYTYAIHSCASQFQHCKYAPSSLIKYIILRFKTHTLV